MNVRRALLSIIMALVLIAPFAPVRADVVLRGDRVDPCQRMRDWQAQVSQDPSNQTALRILVQVAEACAETLRNKDLLCDAYLLVAHTAEVVAKLETDSFSKVQQAMHAYNAYAAAVVTCSGKSSHNYIDDQLAWYDFIESLLKKP
jgi:hypothetical protein